MDRRILRTRKGVVEAVRDLLVSHRWDAVSVQMICDAADISRSTFYAHFSGKDDALALAFEALRTGLEDRAEGRGLEHGRFRFLPGLVAHMRAHLPLFERSRETPSGLALFARFRGVVDEMARAEVAALPSRDGASEDDVTFLVGGLFAMLERWCADGCTVPEGEILEKLDAAAARVLPRAPT